MGGVPSYLWIIVMSMLVTKIFTISDFSDEQKLLEATKQGNATIVEQLLENTFVDVDTRDNLYELPLEKKEFWYGTPLILAGKCV